MVYLSRLQIFGGTDFLLFIPFSRDEWDKIPERIQRRLISALPKEKTSARLLVAETLDAATEAVDQWIAAIEKVLLEEGRGYYPVKAGKGKTAASMKIEIAIKKAWDDGPEGMDIFGAGTSRFFAPASMVLRGEDDKSHYLPCWFAEKKLRELARNARYNRHKYMRISAVSPVWPESLRAAFRRRLHGQLPTQEEKAALEAQKQADEQARREKQRIEQEKWEERQAALREKKRQAAARAEKRKQARRAKMEKKEGVNIEWRTWGKEKGRFFPIDNSADDVTLFFSGSRVYIVFPDGKEIISTVKNVKIIGETAAQAGGE